MGLKARGLSLIELVVTVSLLALTLMVVINMIPAAYLMQNRARFRAAAHQVAQSTLEQQRARPYADLVVGGPTALPERTLEGTSIVFKPTLTIQKLPAYSLTSAKHLRLEIHWEFRGQDEKIVQEVYLTHVPR